MTSSSLRSNSWAAFQGIDIDEVGNGNIGRSELFAIALFGAQPFNGGIVTTFGDHDGPLAKVAPRGVRAGEGRQGAGRSSSHSERALARLSLPTQAKQNKVMMRQYGINEAGNHRIIVPHNPRK